MVSTTLFDRDDLDILGIFRRPKAKIDFITVALPLWRYGDDAVSRLAKALEGIRGRLVLPEKLWEGWFTIHDPGVDELQRLLTEFPELEILALEISVDFYLADGSNDPERLKAMHSWFKKRLFPQQHRLMRQGCVRKYWNSQTGKVVRDRSVQGLGDNSYYWFSKSKDEFVRLYIKTMDDHRELDSHCLRIEVNMGRGGCQNAQVHRLGLLPSFVGQMRRYLTPLFTVAKGIKLDAGRCRSNKPVAQQEHARQLQKRRTQADYAWRTYGAFWAARHKAKVSSNKQVKLLIGEALQALRERLATLAATPEGAKRAKKVEEWRTLYDCIPRASKGLAVASAAAV